LVAFIRYGVAEPKRWQAHAARRAKASFAAIFSPEYRRRTVVNAGLLFVSMVGLWAGSVYVPSSVRHLAGAGPGGYPARMASYGTMLLSAGTILGCLALPWLAGQLGRRGALAAYFALMFVCIAGGFGWVYYLPNALPWFMSCLFLLGVGGANFSVYTLWLPEQYRTECRGSAFAFATSFGRFIAAGVTFLVGAGVARMHTIGTPVALTAVAFLVGLAVLPLAYETRGKELPA
jgi:MFS family permease